jgi:hypothetical protein
MSFININTKKYKYHPIKVTTMKRYYCYCFRDKKKPTFNLVAEYLSTNTLVSESSSLSDKDNVNRTSLLSASHPENNPSILSKKYSLIPPIRNSSDESDDSNDDNGDINRTWRVISDEPSLSCTKSQ